MHIGCDDAIGLISNIGFYLLNCNASIFCLQIIQIWMYWMLMQRRTLDGFKFALLLFIIILLRPIIALIFGHIDENLAKLATTNEQSM